MSLFTSLLSIFFIILLGIICSKREVFNHLQIEGFELLLFKIVMPSYLFVATYQNNLSLLLNTQYIIAFLLTFIILAIIAALLFSKRINRTSIADLYIKVLASGYANAAIYTVPVVTFLLKDPTAAIIGNLLQVIVIQPIFITLLSIVKHKEKSIGKKLFSIITTPILMMPILGILLNYFQIDVFYSIVKAINQIGYGALGFALFVFGLTIGSIKISGKVLKSHLLSLILFKNILHPIIALCIAYFMRLENYWFYALIISASSPTAFVVYLIAKQFSVEVLLIRKVIAVSAVVSMLSLIFITSMMVY